MESFSPEEKKIPEKKNTKIDVTLEHHYCVRLTF